MRTPSAAIFVLTLCLLAVVRVGVSAQQNGATPCPTVVINCPDGPSPGRPAYYSAHVSGGDPSVKPTYRWTVSAGTITGGEGTARISVEAEGSNSLTATVEVGGYPASCPASSSCSWIVGPPRTSRKFDEYGDISLKDERARLAVFAAELKNSPSDEGFIIAYGARRGRAGDARSRGARAKSYMVRRQGMDARRLVVVDGGFREEPAVELFVTPTGAVPPLASPTVEPPVRL